MINQQEDPFARWRSPEPQQQQDEDPFAKWRSPQKEEEPEEEKEGLAHEILRHAGRSVARVAETALGAPRAFGDFFQSLIPEKAVVSGAKKVGLEKPVQANLNFMKKYAPHKLFPKSEDIRQDITKGLFGEKLEPRNEWERKADDLVSDFTALSLPLPGKQIQVLKPALLSLGGNLAAHGVGLMGGDKKQETYAKLGTFLLGSIINPKGTTKLRNDLYSKARAARPDDAIVGSNNLQKRLSQIRSSLSKGGSAESKTKSLKKIDEINESIRNGNIEVEELERFKNSINELLSGLYDEFKTNKAGRAAARRNLGQVSGAIDDALKEYGSTNPEWEAFYRPANEVHGAIAQSKKVREMILRTAKKYGIAHSLALFGIGHVAGAGKAALGATLGTSGLLGGEMIAKALKSPTIRKYYSNVISSAVRDDAIATEQNLKKLDDSLKKEDQS